MVVKKLLLTILMALAVAACGIQQDKPLQVVKGKKGDERLNVVYRYFYGKGQIEGTCRPGETIVTVFCDDPNRYGTVIAPSSSEQATGICTPSSGGGRHKMTLGCSRVHDR
jgi:hypothetical protein